MRLAGGDRFVRFQRYLCLFEDSIVFDPRAELRVWGLGRREVFSSLRGEQNVFRVVTIHDYAGNIGREAHSLTVGQNDYFLITKRSVRRRPERSVIFPTATRSVPS